jgi:hypothetical protein
MLFSVPGAPTQERAYDCDRVGEGDLNLAADAVWVPCDADLAEQRAEVEVQAFDE